MKSKQFKQAKFKCTADREDWFETVDDIQNWLEELLEKFEIKNIKIIVTVEVK